MVEEGNRPTVEIRQGAIDLIATSYRDNKGEFEFLARKYRQPDGELVIPKDPLEAFRLGSLEGLVRSGKLILELAGQQVRIAAIDEEVKQAIAEDQERE